MVYRKRTYRRRRFPRRRFHKARGYRKAMALYKSPTRTGMPQKMFMKLVYTEYYDYSSVVGATTGRVWRGNDLYDINQSGIGAQPLYFDQMMTLYTIFKVVASKIITSVTCTSSTTENGVRVSVYPSISTTAGTLEEAAQQPKAKTIITTGQNGRPAKCKLYNTVKKMLPNTWTTSSVCGNSSNSPTIQWYWKQNISGLIADQTDAVIDTTLIAYVEFSRPVQLTAS